MNTQDDYISIIIDGLAERGFTIEQIGQINTVLRKSFLYYNVIKRKRPMRQYGVRMETGEALTVNANSKNEAREIAEKMCHGCKVCTVWWIRQST